MPSGQYVDYIEQGDTFKEARYATDTRRGYSFEKWRIEPKLSTEYPENELVEYNGRWLLPRHAADEQITEENR